ncbi:AI-2E family transporter [Paraglaciecola sp.]|uniref:AI-2E family transporter n=1 Tax=Paraglaciecola sp. TaxID=1920173 RepID=UPI00273F880C|nr:AI-2E family transporter [Paraglaciecola sp.]MDP5029564.1 AI-2E family transporter [Paraglaciecola sp.]
MNMQSSEQGSTANEQALAKKLSRTAALNWLAVLAILYTLYFAQTLLLTLIATFLLALLISPLVTLFKRAHVPRLVSALLLVTLLIAPFSFLGVQLAQPVQKWAQLLPQLSKSLNEQLESINSAIQGEETQGTTPPPKEKSRFTFFGWLDDETEEQQETEEENMVTERIKQGSLEVLVSMLAATPLLLAQVFTGLVLILFLLIFGPGLFQAYVNGLNEDSKREQAIHLATTIQVELSRYIGTISLINAALGASTAVVLKLLGVEDALLWGVLAALLNFIPYVGSVIGMAILSLAGVTQYGLEWMALMPPAVYFGLNLIESQFVTPTVLGRNMRLNPLVVVLWLVIWGWLWGAFGVLLAVPLLVCIKLAIGQLGIWPQWIAVIEKEG